jgi:hypothetical protein
VQDFIAASGHDFVLVPLREIGKIAKSWVLWKSTWRIDKPWYPKGGMPELERSARLPEAAVLGAMKEKPLQDEITFWESFGGGSRRRGRETRSHSGNKASVH